MARQWFVHAVVSAMVVGSLVGHSSGEDIRYRGYLPRFPLPAPAMGVGPNGAPATWMGGDASWSTPLDQTRSIWTFCDPGIAPPGTISRKDPQRPIKGVANTVAIASCKDGKFSATHYYRGNPEHPLPFFEDPNNPTNDDAGSRLWLCKNFLYRKKLFVFAHQIMQPGPAYNTFLIRVDNPFDSPLSWNFEYLSLGVLPPPKAGAKPRSRSAPFTFGNEAHVDEREGYLYTYGFVADNNSENAYDYFHKFQVTALRIPLEKLLTAPAWYDLALDSQYMSARFGEWKPGLFEDADCYRVGIPSIFSFSVRYNETLRAWQTVFLYDGAIADFHGKALSGDDPKVNSVFIMTGKTRYGPWSPPVLLARLPEMNPGEVKIPDRPQGPDSYAYRLQEQVPYEVGDGDVAITYTIGSVFEIREHNMELRNNDNRVYTLYGWTAPNPFFVPAAPFR